MSQRALQIGSIIAAETSAILARGLADPRIKGLITVTGADVTGDLERCTIRVSVLPEEHAKLTMHGLASATPHIRRMLSDRVRIKEIPEIRFKHDRATAAAAETQRLIAKGMAEANQAGLATDPPVVDPHDDAPADTTEDRTP